MTMSLKETKNPYQFIENEFVPMVEGLEKRKLLDYNGPNDRSFELNEEGLSFNLVMVEEVFEYFHGYLKNYLFPRLFKFDNLTFDEYIYGEISDPENPRNHITVKLNFNSQST